MNSSLWGNVVGASPLLLLCLGLLAGALANDSDAEVASFFSDEVETRRLEALRAACGELCNTSAPVRFYFCDPTPEHPCLQDVVLPWGQWDPLQKQANCPGLIHSPHILAKRPPHIPAPERIPPALLDAYSYQGAVTINYFPEGHPSRPISFFKFPNIGQGYNSHEPVWHTPWANVDDMQRECAQGSLQGSYGEIETRLAFLGLRQMALAGKHVLVYGSERPWLEACALAAGAAKVTTIEHSTIVSKHPDIEVLTPHEAAHRHATGELPVFDAIASFSSVEHSGLGRYGDALNPWGDITMIGQAWCLSKPGALMLLSAPIAADPDTIVWNSGRIYGAKTFPHVVANWEQVWRAPRSGDLRPPHLVQIFRSLKAAE